MEERKVNINGVQYNLCTNDEIVDMKVCSEIEYKEKLRKKNLLKFYDIQDVRKLFETENNV